MTDIAKHVLRDYQTKATDAFLTIEDLSALIQLPTGCGKTLTCANIFERFTGRRCLFLAHTDELVRQTCRTMIRQGLWPKVEKADEYTGLEYIPTTWERRNLFGGGWPANDWFTFGKVWVSSMQTFKSRIDKYAARAGLTCCASTRHTPAVPDVRDHRQSYPRPNPRMKLLGLTATPTVQTRRTPAMFPAFAYQMPILDAMDNGGSDVGGVGRDEGHT